MTFDAWGVEEIPGITIMKDYENSDIDIVFEYDRSWATTPKLVDMWERLKEISERCYGYYDERSNKVTREEKFTSLLDSFLSNKSQDIVKYIFGDGTRS